MASNTINTRIQLKNDTEAHWDLATNFIPREGEAIIYSADSTHPFSRLKVGDGNTTVGNLPFLHADSSNGILDYDFTKFPNGLNYKGIIINKDTNTYTLIGENDSVDAKHGDLVQDSNEDYYAFEVIDSTTQPATTRWLKLTPIDLGQSEKLITERTLYYYKGNNNISKLGTITQGTWNATTIDVSHGGTGRETFTKSAILYGNGNGALNSGIMSWEQNWTNGTVNGPTIKLQIANTGASTLEYALPTIPIATPTNSGVITTGAQNLMGVKTLVNGELRIKCNGDNIRQNNKIIFGTIASTNSNNNNTIFTIDKNEWASINVKTPYDRSNNSDLTETGKIQFSFKQYGTAIDVNNNTYDSTSYYEEYVLPESTISTEENTNKIYNILTTKNTITVEQGGTGQTTFTTNSVLYGNATSGLSSINSANGALYSTSANGTLSWGTLPVEQGGTGQTSFTENAILYGNGSGAIQAETPQWKAWIGGTTSGPQAVFHIGNNDYTSATIPSASTSASGIVTTNVQSFAGNKTFTGTIYINNNTSASSKTTGALIVDGGAGFEGTVYANAFNGPLTGSVTGNITGHLTRITSFTKGNNPSSAEGRDFCRCYDSNGISGTNNVISYVGTEINDSGKVTLYLRAYKNTANATTSNALGVSCAADGTCSYSMSDPAAFKAALTLGTAAMDVRIGSYDGVTQHWGIGAIVQATTKGTKAYLGKRTTLVTTDTGCFLYNNTDSAIIWSWGKDSNNRWVADRATALNTSRSLWGNNFDGSADVSGSMSIKALSSANVGTSSNNGNTGSSNWYQGLAFVDKNNYHYGEIYTALEPGGRVRTYMYSKNKKTDGTEVTNILNVGVNKDGTRYYSVSDAAAFRTAIGAGTSSLTIGTSSTTAMAGNTTVTNVSQGATTTSSWRKIMLSGGDAYAAYNTAVGDTRTAGVYMAQSVSVQPSTGTIRAAKFYGDVTGNSSTATKWADSIMLTINGTGKAIDGSANVSFSASEIGLSSYLPLGGGTLTGSLGTNGGIILRSTATTSDVAYRTITGGATNNSTWTSNNITYTVYAGDWGNIRIRNRYKSVSSGTTTWNPARIEFRAYSATANSGTHLNYYDCFALPGAADGKTANNTYSILTTKAAVTVGQGGTGATTKANARKNLGIRSDTTTGGITVNSGSYVDVDVTWDALDTVPDVVVGFTTASSAGSFGRCSVSVKTGSVTKTGCTFRLYNGDSSNRSPDISYIAIG